MLYVSQAVGLAAMVWFYTTAEKHGESPMKWVIIGTIGFWMAWWAVKLTLVKVLAGWFAKSFAVNFITKLLPPLFAALAAYLVRKKLLADLPTNRDQNLS